MTLFTPARFVHQSRAETAGPVQHAILERRDEEGVVNQRKGIGAWIVLPPIRIPSAEIVLGVDLPIQLEIALVGIHVRTRRIHLVET
jgi:hypothetical protein